MAAPKTAVGLGLFGGTCWVLIHKVLVLQMSGVVILSDDGLVRTFMSKQLKVKAKL